MQRRFGTRRPLKAIAAIRTLKVSERASITTTMWEKTTLGTIMRTKFCELSNSVVAKHTCMRNIQTNL